ncbi:MAG: acetyl-CoA carboxylase, carboxyltransferase subunit beta [Planctomycetota bacterium]|nr:acetyl-CoA carboxylase, carboxyltransferase subunit beta [Planctomycetota bacterium]
MADKEPDPRPGRLSRLRFKKKDMPDGLWLKCPGCDTTIYRKELVAKGHVCPSCAHHFTVPGRERVAMVLDEGSWHELHPDLESLDRLNFTDAITYAEKLVETQNRTGQKDALFCGLGRIEGRPIVLAVLDFKFLGGSMGEVVGEKVSLACDEARTRRLPVVIFTSSGGARMHEGVLSLMQMAKTCSALSTLNEAGGLSICVLTNPTTGGVTASFASVCDLTLAEPGALIGFAGPRVIQSTIRQELPEGFQRSEFLIEKGQVDRIVSRGDLRDELAALIDYGTVSWKGYPPPLPEPPTTPASEAADASEAAEESGDAPASSLAEVDIPRPQEADAPETDATIAEAVDPRE